MRLYDLQEAKGFVNRKIGDQFIAPDKKDIATFIKLDRLPQDYPRYDSPEEMMEAVIEWEETAEGYIYEVNKPSSRFLAAVIVTMDTPRGLEHYIKYVTEVGNLKGKISDIPPGVIPGHGGYKLNTAASTSERSGLKPAEVLTNESLVKPNQVAALLNNARGKADPVVIDNMQGYLKALAKGNGVDYVIKDAAKDLTLYQKYLGEWAAPIALITKQFEPSSQINEIQENLTNGTNLNVGSILYNTDVNALLFDSMVVISDYEILISSKASAGGASASLKGIHDAMTKYADKFPTGFWNRPRAKKFRNIVLQIADNSMVNGTLEIAKQYGLVDINDINKIKSGLDKYNTKDFKPSINLKKYMNNYPARTDNKNYHPAKHALAGVARQAVRLLNDEDYSDVLKEVLNHASMVQMYFDARLSKQDVICKIFKLVWPMRFEGKITFDAGRSFTATDINGKIGFRIGAGNKASEPVDPTLLSTPDDQKRQKAQAKAAEKKAQQAVGRIVKPGERDIRDPRVPDTVALGRAKKR